MMRFPFSFFLILCMLGMMPMSDAKTYDYLIRNAKVYDGGSFEPHEADVAVEGDKIAAVGNLLESKGRQGIDAKGLVLAPGFIDTHTHSDFNPVVYPDIPN